jgi:hypothetical protein
MWRGGNMHELDGYGCSVSSMWAVAQPIHMDLLQQIDTGRASKRAGTFLVTGWFAPHARVPPVPSVLLLAPFGGGGGGGGGVGWWGVAVRQLLL